MRFWEFVFTALVSEVTPGPNMGYLVALSLAQGRRAGLAAVAGVALGLALLGCATAFGVGLLSEAVPGFALALRWCGVLYLLWLAVDSWRDDQADGRADMAVSFRRGLVTNLLNPKAAIFYVAVIPLFLPAPASQQQVLFLTAVFVAIATAVHAVLVVGASQVRALLFHPDRERAIRRCAALSMAAVALWFAWSTR